MGDAKETMWGRFVVACINYLPVILVMLLIWAVRVEIRIGPDGFSAKDAMELKETLPSKELVNSQFDDLKRHLDRLEAAQTHTNDRIDEFIAYGGGR